MSQLQIKVDDAQEAELAPKNEVITLENIERDREARDLMAIARIAMLKKWEFMGDLSLKLPLVNANAWCPTAATDGNFIFYNTDFVLGLKEHSNVVFLLCHEILHNAYDHFARTGDRYPWLANLSQDYVVNGDLVKSNIGKLIESALYDRKFDDFTFEEVHEHLYKDLEDQIKEMMKNGFNPADWKPGENDDEFGGGIKLPGSALDDHMNDDPSGENKDAGIQKDQDGNLVSTQRPNPTAKEKEQTREKIRSDIVDSFESTKHSPTAGNIPGALKRMIESWLRPKIDWTELVDASIESCLKSDYSLMRPGRKGQEEGIYLPGMINDEMIDVVISIDMSGSISADMIRAFFSEIKGMMDQYSDFKIRIWTFDTAVYPEGDTEFTPYNIDDLQHYDPIGGGGTEFMCNWEYMKENDIQPNLFIMFTDGMPWGEWGDELYCDTVFIIHDAYGTPVPPFGNYAYYDSKQQYSDDSF